MRNTGIIALYYKGGLFFTLTPTTIKAANAKHTQNAAPMPSIYTQAARIYEPNQSNMSLQKPYKARASRRNGAMQLLCFIRLSPNMAASRGIRDLVS